MRRLGAVAASLLLSFGLIAGYPSAVPVAAAASTAAPKASPGHPIRGQSFSVSGRLRTRVVRPVQLQRKAGSKWTRIASGKTTASGRYSFKTSLSASSAKLRVVAAKVKVGKKTYKRVITKARSLRTVALTPAVPMVGESFTVAETLGKRGARPVSLQRKVGGRWVKIRSGKTSASGKFSFSVSLPGSSDLRVVAPKAKVGKKKYAKRTLRAFRVTTAAQTAKISLPRSGLTNQALVATAKFHPARTGRTVTMQRLIGTAWKTVATARQNSTGSAVVAVTPTTTGNQTYRLVAAAYRGAAAVATRSASVTVSSGVGLPSIVTKELPAAVAGETYATTLVAAGGVAPYKWSATGLPEVVTITAAGKLSGTPTTSGKYSVRLTITDAAGKQANTNLSLVVGPVVSIGFGELPDAISGSDYDTTLTGTGGTAPYTWSATGLPTGITLASDGHLSGTTTAVDTHTVSLTITDAKTRTATKDVDFTVNPALGITTAALPEAMTNSPYSLTMAAIGGTPPFTWTATGLPSGMSLSASGVLSGTPTATGTSPNVKITITDATATAAMTTFSFSVLGVTTIAMSGSHSCAVTSAGGVRCWGSNNYGQLGNGTTTDSTTPVSVTGLASGVTSVATGANHSCAITSTGAVKCWGQDTAGSTPVDVTGLTSGVTAITAGSGFNCAITSTGAVKCWGKNSYGQLGNGTTDESTTPVDVSGLGSDTTTVTAGDSHTCALTSTGAAKCWGRNSVGQLGNGTNGTQTVPVDVTDLASGVTAISAGSGHSCAITSTGAAKCWGGNDYGQLGNSSTNDTTTAVTVTGLASGATAIAAGTSHSCAITSTGAVKCWGRNTYGQLGNGNATDNSTPVAVSSLTSGATAIAGGSAHSCALTSTGVIKCWGSNAYGQLGNGVTAYSTTSVDVTGLTSGITTISAGFSHSCALTSTGAAKCWGSNDFGQLGDGTTTASTTSVDVTGLTSGITTIAAGTSHSCALTSTGGVKCWGRNANGQLGNGTTTNANTSVDVTDLTSGVISIGAGVAHSCALTSTGGVKCWGANAFGQLGDGTTTTSRTPVEVSGLGSGVTAITAGGNHSCALTSTGGVKCWGRGLYGQLGNGANANINSTPVEVSGLGSGVAAIAAGGNFSCALTSTGAVKCWGRRTSGQLDTDSTTPVDVSGLGSGVAAITAGSNHSCALTTTGAAKCWGINGSGQLGNGTTTDSATPVEVAGLDSGVTAVTGGGTHSCATTDTGNAKCWGSNGYGQLGNSAVTADSPIPVGVVWPTS